MMQAGPANRKTSRIFSQGMYYLQHPAPAALKGWRCFLALQPTAAGKRLSIGEHSNSVLMAGIDLFFLPPALAGCAGGSWYSIPRWKCGACL